MHGCKTLLFLGLNTLLLNGVLLADEETAPTLKGDIGPTLLQLAGAMILIIVIIYVSLWLMKRYSGGKITGGGNLITILERKHLNPKQAIYLVKVGEQHLLIGASDNGLNKLGDIDAIDTVPPVASKTVSKPASMFSQILKQAKGTILPRMSVKEKSAEA